MTTGWLRFVVLVLLTLLVVGGAGTLAAMATASVRDAINQK